MTGSVSFFGKTSRGLEAIKNTIRIVATHETFAIIDDFSKRSGLLRNEFAVNSWGFPYIPKVFLRTGFHLIRTAPEGVNKAYFGHPIYWIDPELTKMRDGESEQEWCIRMFLLIDGFGYWDEDANFVDFLQVNGFSYNDDAIEVYHHAAGKETESDAYKLLSVDDLEVSLDRIEEIFNEVRQYCYDIQRQESAKMLEIQIKHYRFAKNILGDHIYSWDATFDDPGSIWDERFSGDLMKIADAYNRRAKKKATKIADMQQAAWLIQDRLEKLVAQMNHASSVLELPVKASVGENPGGAARLSLIATVLDMSNRKDNLRKTVFKQVDDAFTEAFSSGNQGVGGFDTIISAMSDVYSLAWGRLRLALVNYDNLRMGEKVFATTMDMQTAMTQSKTDGNGGDNHDLDTSDASDTINVSSLEDIMNQKF